MKYIVLISSIFLFASCILFANQKNVRYKVYKIELVNSYYVIYCERGNQKYKIVSKKNNDKSKNRKSKKISVGQLYDFVLNPYHPDAKDNNPLTNSSTAPYVIRCYMFTDTKICEEEGIKLYTTRNLIDLYYVK